MGDLLFLHLSDLHFSIDDRLRRFSDAEIPDLAKKLAARVKPLKERINPKLFRVIVTGDITQSAKPKEYQQAIRFFTALINPLDDVKPDHVLFVPGNHDVSRALCRSVEAEQEDYEWDDEIYQRKLREKKFESYNKFLDTFIGDLKGIPKTKKIDPINGALVYDFASVRTSIACLNSCEEITHKIKQGSILQPQAQALLNYWQDPRLKEYIKIIALHHNLGQVPEVNIDKIIERMKKTEDKLSSEVIDQIRADIVGIDKDDFIKNIISQVEVSCILSGHQHISGYQTFPWLDPTFRTPSSVSRI
ncbi:metallophosphoesterase family protein [Magnetococcales bacterium HHB-1]